MPEKKRAPPEHGGRLSPQQMKCIELELSGRKAVDIRRECNISDASWYRWHRIEECPQYVTELERRRSEAFGEATEVVRSQLADLVDWRFTAIRVLREMAEDEAYEPGVRVRAAAECARAASAAIEACGFVPPAAPTLTSGALNEVKGELQEIRAVLETQGLAALLAEAAAGPTEDEADPDAALRRAHRRIAELEGKV